MPDRESVDPAISPEESTGTIAYLDVNDYLEEGPNGLLRPRGQGNPRSSGVGLVKPFPSEAERYPKTAQINDTQST